MTLTVYNLFDGCAGVLDFSTPDTSFSPFFSSVGLGARDGAPGVGPLWMHFNRKTREVFSAVAEYGAPFSRAGSDPFCLRCEESLTLSFYDKNAFVCEGVGDEPFRIFVPARIGVRCWVDEAEGPVLLLRGFSASYDERDPDTEAPFALAVSARAGSVSLEENGLFMRPENGRWAFAAAFVCLEDVETDEATVRAANAPSAEEAAALSLEWAKNCVSGLRLPVDDAQTERMRGSILGLLFNLTRAEGRLRDHLSAFPSRGEYPTHFLWDTCFQNLAYEEMNTEIAADLLLQNIENQRSDGKYAQFLCSTWERPGESQPPLIGWAGVRLLRKTADPVFAERLLDSIVRNNAWWLTARATDTGLVYTLGGLETGQDDSPRFDGGPTIACDMNAYLLRQLFIAARLADRLGRPEAPKLLRQAEAFSHRLRETLYCEEDAIFYDRRVSDGEPVRIVSPAGLLPLWAADPLPPGEARRCIERHLLNPYELFGQVPFPSVAYNDPAYDPAGWWRGPMWAPEAWLMLETLQRYGYKMHARVASERLYAVMARDGRTSELFNSRTGEGLGAAQQGWTAAVFMQLRYFLNRS